jgi:oligopeptidase B
MENVKNTKNKGKNMKSYPIILILIFTVNLISEERNLATKNPPNAKKNRIEKKFHGDTRIDYYEWLRDDSRTNQEVLHYIEKENLYAKSILEESKELKDKIYNEIATLRNQIDKEKDFEILEKNGYFYYKRKELSKEYYIYCRKKGSLEAKEEVYFDANKLAEELAYFDYNFLKISPDQNLLAFGIDSTGDEIYNLKIIDLRTREILTDKANGVSELEWFSDSKTFVYASCESSGDYIPKQIKKHIIGQNMEDDKIIYQEKNEEFGVELIKSKNEDFIFVDAGYYGWDEFSYFKTNDENQEMKKIASRDLNLDLNIKNAGKYFYIYLAGETFPNGKIVRISTTAELSADNYEEIVSHQNNLSISRDFVCYQHVLLYKERNLETGFEDIKIVDLNTLETSKINFPEQVIKPNLEDSSNYSTNKIKISYESPKTPKTYIYYDIETKQIIKNQPSYKNGYDSSLYEVERKWIPSFDDVKVPLTIVYRKDLLKKDSTNPSLIHAYGAYGENIELEFRADIIPLLNRGVIYTISHVRGGGELGNKWYEDGILFNRKNRIKDFVSSLEYLISNNYTNSGMTICTGASAGGELMLSVANERPDLLNTIIANVAPATILDEMLDPTIDGVIYHYDEIGNPQEKEFYEYIKTYCPYENIKEQSYPNMLLTTSLTDSRVLYWQALKYSAKLRAKKKNDSINILKTSTVGGHFGAGSWYENRAEEYAFALKLLGISK